MLAAVQVEERIRALGFSEADTRTLADHFLDAERRGKRGHGLARVDWLETLEGLDPAAEPECVVAEACYERWEGRGALGYLTLAAICDGQLEDPPEAARLDRRARLLPDRRARLLGAPARRGRAPRRADGDVAAAARPSRRRARSSPGRTRSRSPSRAPTVAPIVSDVSMGRVTYGDVIAGAASEDELVPFGGEHAHKAFALALGLQLLVDSLVGDGYGAVLLVAQPAADPVPALRSRAAGFASPATPDAGPAPSPADRRRSAVRLRHARRVPSSR